MTLRAPPDLRVLHVTAALCGGGAESMVRTLVPHLARRGIDVAVFCAYEAGLTNAERAQLDYGLIEGHKSGRFDYTFGLRLTRAIRSFRPHVVHTHTVTGKYWGRACAAAAGVPHIVHTEHSSYFARWERPLAPILAARTDAVISFSPRTAELVCTREPVLNMHVIPNGVDLTPLPTCAERAVARERLGASPELVVFGMIASLIPLKNHELAIRAFANLPTALRLRSRLDIFGRGPRESALRNLARTAGISDRVVFRGFCENVRSVLPGLDALLTVSSTEAAPLSLLEGMSAALPILGTPHHGTLDLVLHRRTGLVIAGWTAGAVAAALQHAIVNPAWRLRAGLAGRQRVERDFNIETIAGQHIDLYRRLMDSPRIGASTLRTANSAEAPVVRLV